MTNAVAAALLLVIGFCFSTWTANSQSILQLTAPDRLRGRVLGLYLFAFAGLTPIGGLLAGWLVLAALRNAAAPGLSFPPLSDRFVHVGVLAVAGVLCLIGALRRREERLGW